MFGNRLPLKQLSVVCRSLGTTLHAGVPIIKAVELASRKASQPQLHGALSDVVQQIKSGTQVAAALDEHSDIFPDLMIDMVRVGENTGMLPEVFRSLAEHYENNLRLKKDFISQISWPVVQFFAALFVIAGLILLMGMIGSGPNRLDPLGFGLFGVQGALVWLGGWAALLAAGYVAWRLVMSSPAGQKALFTFLMRVPVVGTCLESFAVARFSWAFHLTQDAGMPIDESIRQSLRATSNGAFISAADRMVDDVENGDSLTEAIAQSELFSEDFVQMVQVGETTGTVPETLHRLSPQFEEQARRSLRTLSTAAGWAVWGAVAALIIFLIFRIALWYVGMINDATQGL